MHAARVEGPDGSLWKVFRVRPSANPAGAEPDDDRLRALIDNLPVLVSYWDKDERCRLANSTYVDWFGVDPSEIGGMTFRELLGDDRYPDRKRHIDAALRGERVFFERSLVDADGVTKNIQVTYVPDVVEGHVAGFFVLTTDVTQLNALVEARTRELRVAQEDAERANRAKDDFIATVSHEMRTPLHAIKSYTRLLQLWLADGHETSAEKADGYLKRIDASILRLAHFVDSILGISAYRSGRSLPLNLPIDLHEAVHSSVRAMLPILDEKSQHVQIVPNSEPARVEADPQMVEQVVTNLLANASRYSPEGSLVVVEVAACGSPGDLASSGEGVRITVFDQGVGIPEDELESIFGRFQQTSRTRRGSGGTGLGLAICREIMSLHGGSIKGSNNPDGGARFDVWFPLRQVDSSQESQGVAD